MQEIELPPHIEAKLDRQIWRGIAIIALPQVALLASTLWSDYAAPRLPPIALRLFEAFSSGLLLVYTVLTIVALATGGRLIWASFKEAKRHLSS